jgi:predicted MFS family arabinose efflux permease
VGTLASGWLTDRFDPRRLLFVYYLLRGLSLLVLDPALDARSVGLLGFMMFYGLDWVATVPPTVALCNDLVGRAKAPVVYGWVFAGHQLGAALAAWFAGATRDWTGSYRLSFLVAAGMCFVAAVGTQRIRRTRVVTTDLQPALAT